LFGLSHGPVLSEKLLSQKLLGQDGVAQVSDKVGIYSHGDKRGMLGRQIVDQFNAKRFDVKSCGIGAQVQ